MSAPLSLKRVVLGDLDRDERTVAAKTRAHLAGLSEGA
jgi:hypothetical protein